MPEPIVKKAASIFVALSTMALLSGAVGCGIGTVAPSGPVSLSGITISGNVHGGDQPISGATIQLYAAGSTGYGTGATTLISKTVTTGTDGSFSITGDYSCASVTTPVYLTANGGNPGLPGTVNNTAIELAAPLGTCGNLTSTTNILINEVTTAATAIALGQYFTTTLGATSTDAFGAPNATQAQLGLSNAFATVNNLVDTTTGYAVTTATLTGAGNTVTTTPEYQKVYTIADILASCVSTSGGASGSATNCGTLFADVTPTGGTPPTDVLQAAVDMELNPTSNNSNGSSTNLASLYSLVSATSPFPDYSPQPTDWTVGIQYTDAGAAQTFFLKPQNIAVDGLGNVWVLSDSASTGLGALVEIGPTGTPESDISTLHEYGPYKSPVTSPPALSSPKNTTTTFTTQDTAFTITFGAATNNPAMTPRNLAIDPTNNVWLTQTTGVTDAVTNVPTSGAVFEVATTGGLPTGSTYGFSTGKSAYGLAIDGSGDVFVGQESSSSYFALYEFPYSATPGAGLLTPIAFPIYTATPGTAGTTGTDSYQTADYMAFDNAGNLWIDGGSNTGSNFTVELSNINTSSCGTLTAGSLCQVTTTTSLNTFTSYSLTGGATAPYQLAADSAGMFVPSEGTGNGVNDVTYASPGINTFVGGPTEFTTPKSVAVDGAGNVWVPNYNGTPAGATPTAGGSVSELSSAGVLLSPVTPDSTELNPGFVHAGLSFGDSVAIDPSGNVWVANYTAAPGSIFEIVGAAVPTVTPISLALKESKVGLTP